MSKYPQKLINLIVGLTLLLSIIGTSHAQLVSAITRDLNGNGFIDRIDLAFSQTVSISTDMIAAFSIKQGNIILSVDSIVKLSDPFYSLLIHELVTAAPQTGWQPTISITNVPGIANTQFLSSDGCPPVIRQVRKYCPIVNDRTHDSIRVYFSEKIKGANGSALNITNSPYEVFDVYVFDPQFHTMIRADSMLQGINYFQGVVNDSMLIFCMINGRNLTSDFYLGIRTDQLRIQDVFGNFASITNQKVKVTSGDVPSLDVQIAGYNNIVCSSYTFDLSVPPVIKATGSRIPPKVFFLRNQPEGLNWLCTDGAGALFLTSFSGFRDSLVDSTVTFSVNITNSADSVVRRSNFTGTSIKSLLLPGSINAAMPQLIIYWNGYDNLGLPLARGNYCASFLLDFSNQNISDLSAQTCFEMPGTAVKENGKMATTRGIKIKLTETTLLLTLPPNSDKSPVSIQIFRPDGKRMYSLSFFNSAAMLSIPKLTWASGIYLLSISSNLHKTEERFIVER
jgi:hypothetical protein